MASLGLASIGCGDDRFFLGPPPGPELGAVIFSIEGAPSAPPPIASELSRRIELSLADEGLAEARLVARVFDRDLAALDLAAGDLEPLASGGRELLHTKAFAHSLSELDETSWTPIEASTLRAAAPVQSCPKLEVIVQTLESSDELGFALALDGETAWVGVRDRSLWEVTTESVTRLDDLAADVPVDVGHRGPLGDWWLGGAGGRVFAAQASTSSLSGSLVVDDPQLGLVQWLAGGRLQSGGFEIFGVSQEGIVFRARSLEARGPVTVDILHRFEVARPGRGAGVVWLSPGRAAVGLEWSGELVFIDGDEISMMRPPIQENTGITAVAEIESFGLVVGGSQGSIAQLDGEWRSLGGSGLTFLVHVIAPSRDGFFAMGTLGYVARYDPMGMRFCEPEKVARNTVYATAILDEHLVLVDTNPSRDRVSVRFVER